MSDVIQKALRKEIRWIDAADILGLSVRQVSRLRERLQTDGAAALRDARRGKVPKNRIPDQVSQKVLDLYRNEFAGFNAKHFHEQLADYDIDVSYVWTKALLLEAGLLQRGKKRKTYRRRREREPMPGMLVHLDGSKHRWFDAGNDSMQDLLAFVDDATGEILAARLVPEESTRTVLSLLRDVVEDRGTFGRLYTDRASHFVVTPVAGQGPDRTKKTQVERVLDDLGIELVCAYSPQARGRSERLWRTLQGRLPLELKRAGACDYEAANAYLRSRFVGRFNAKFTVAPTIDDSAFVPCARADVERLFALRFDRVVGNDHTIRFHNRVLQLEKPRGLCPLQKRLVHLRLTLDGRVDVYLGTRLLQSFEARDLDLDDPALAA